MMNLEVIVILFMVQSPILCQKFRGVEILEWLWYTHEDKCSKPRHSVTFEDHIACLPSSSFISMWQYNYNPLEFIKPRFSDLFYILLLDTLLLHWSFLEQDITEYYSFLSVYQLRWLGIIMVLGRGVWRKAPMEDVLTDIHSPIIN